MAEIEITLPTVQYGNVKVRATPEELGLDSVGDAAALGVAAAVYLTTFTLGFKRGAQIDVDIDDSMAHVGSGPYKTVSAPQGASQEVSEAQAQRYLDEGLGGVTEVSEDDEYDSATEAKEAAQARTSDAPWDNKVDAKPKPWETGEQAPAAPAVKLDSSW